MSNTRDKLPPERAAALRYTGIGAPTVVASGEGVVAERIRALATEHDIPFYENQKLVELLCQIPLGDEIPESLYIAVAEILAFVYYLDVSLDESA
ncbi:MAG: EscU/YscU/HrcU family type III secretion system export apparatus switch protein [Halieaceae bacterium]|uniref:EscU/YscU/HrcU family type III secretion system export apparatus switch protein n=1 Tax=Haliea alexandrii TaxID=2448162 RepID=UPI000F0B5037|nr:EscU/YscU/HrcU family type III secretion system export apparatus switch protein [Haliea alexandrii]MCR9184152.1 EscU/YscU/HrcU family type III secretion system export apparatus switch protein [Halieaceae bacterium]